MTADGAAQILDRGYRRYDGSRSGTAGAVRSVAWHTTRSILGLGRKARHKVFPVIVLVIAFIPTIIFLGLAILIGDLLEEEIRPEFWELFGFSITPILIFAALVAPEAIVRDRRDGMLSLYLSTPLTRASYLAAKTIAVMGTMLIITLGPPVLALLGWTFQSQGPDGVVEWFEVLGKLSVAAVVIAAVLTALSLGVSSLTDRRAFASVGVIMLLLGALIVVGVLTDPDVVAWSPELRVLDPVNGSLEVAARLFGDRNVDPDFTEVDTWLVAAGAAGWIAAGTAVVAWRYRRLGAA